MAITTNPEATTATSKNPILISKHQQGSSHNPQCPEAQTKKYGERPKIKEILQIFEENINFQQQIAPFSLLFIFYFCYFDNDISKSFDLFVCGPCFNRSHCSGS
jgi:hypothetical protein